MGKTNKNKELYRKWMSILMAKNMPEHQMRRRARQLSQKGIEPCPHMQ